MADTTQLFAAAICYQRVGRLAEAEVVCRRIVAADPKHADAWLLLGIIALESNNSSGAIEFLQRSVSLDPSDVVARNNLGVALRNQGDLHSAVLHFRRAAELAPQLAEAQFNLARVLHSLGDLNAASASYEKTLSLMPECAEAWYRLANILDNRGRLEEAIDSYQRSLLLNPDQPEVLVNLGANLQRLGRASEAAAVCRRALDLRPDFAEAFNRLGVALRFLGSIQEATTCFRRAIELDPGSVEALNNLGNVLKDAGLLDDSLACRRQAIRCRPDFQPAQSNFLYAIQFSSDYDAAAIYDEHRRWSRSYAAPLAATVAPHTNNRNSNRRLRIGYVSPHFRNHTLACALVPVFRSHNHANFEIICYHDGPVEDDITRQLRSYADAWHSLIGLTDEQAAFRMKGDEIDIVVDLTMHMSDGRPLLFARKPAPIQVCWLAYPGTTGLTTIDYRFTDSYIDPPGLFDQFYCEESIRLPHSFWCYDPLTNEPSVSRLPALNNGFITFGNLNNPCKTNDRVFDLWARILKSVEQSRLVLLVLEATQESRLQAAFKERGIEPDRIFTATLRPRSPYLRLYHQIDIGLETLPYNGHNTSLDSFWMGVPVPTIVGQTVVGRAGVCLLENLALPELIAQSPDEYVRIVSRLATDLPRLSELRANLRSRMQHSPLMDGPQFAKDMEAAYRQIWRRWCD